MSDRKNKSKKEINPMWIMGLLFIVCIGGLFYIGSQKQASDSDITGLKTNSNKLKKEVPNKGLQENDNELDPNETSGKTTGTAKGLKNSSGSAASMNLGEQNVGAGSTDNSKGKGTRGVLANKASYTEEDLNRLGWQALNGDAPDEAKQLFEVVLERQPDHFHSSAGLGKAYEKLGQGELAGKQYCHTAGLSSLSAEDKRYWLGAAEQVGFFCP